MIRLLLEKNKIFYANIIILFFLSNGVISRANLQLDLSKDRINSVTRSTKKVFRSLETPVLVEAYITQKVTGEILRGILPIVSTLKEMKRIGGDKIQLRIYDPDTEDLRNKAQSREIQGIQVEERKDAEASVRLGYFGVYMQMEDKSHSINLIDKNWFVRDIEYRILKQVKKFLQSKEKSGIAFAEVPGAVSIVPWSRIQDKNKDNLYGFKSVLRQEKGEIESILLNTRIPDRIQTIFLVGLPRLEKKEEYYLDQFLLRGGNLICMFKSFQFQIKDPDPRLAQFGVSGGGSLGNASLEREDVKKLNEWISGYGISLKTEILLEPKQAMPVWDFQGRIPFQTIYPAWAVYSKQTGNLMSKKEAMTPITQLVIPWFSSLILKETIQSNVQYEVLAQTSLNAVSVDFANMNYKEVQRLASSTKQYLGYKAPIAVWASGKFNSVFTPSSIPSGVRRNFYQRTQQEETQGNLAVIASPYMVSDILLHNQNGLQVFNLNRAFLLNLLEMMEGDTDLAEARSRQPTLSTLNVESKFFQKLVSWILSFAFPVFFGIFGTLYLIRRAKKRGVEKA